MIRFYTFSNPALRRRIEESGWRCEALESGDKRLRSAVVFTTRSHKELEAVSGFVNELSRSNSVYMILRDPREREPGCVVSSPSGAYLTSKDTAFLRHFLEDDVVKRTCADLDISRSGYYKTLDRLVRTLGCSSPAELKAWALMHLGA